MTEILSTPKSNDSSNSFVASARVNWIGQLARPEQIPDEGEWSIWLYLAGRGSGKTRAAAEWLAWNSSRFPDTRWACIAPTFADARDTCAEGQSGILSVLKRYRTLGHYNRSMGEIVLTNGSRIKLFSGDEPDRLRGPQFHGAWIDELAAFKYPDTFDQLQFGLRLGEHPRLMITTTPRPVTLIRSLCARRDGSVKVVRGSTFDNAANLAPQALIQLQARYGGTKLGRQELYGEVLDDVEGALWTRAMIEDSRVDSLAAPIIYRMVVAVDPAVTSGEEADETGIITVGASPDGHYYVIADDSIRSTPVGWARRAIESCKQHGAERIVAETNNGGDLVLEVLKQVDSHVLVKKVTASRGKQVRAEPISALYEQGRVHHIGEFPILEDQMVNWTPDSNFSPDRMDALVWAITELATGAHALRYLASISKFCPKCGLPNRKSGRNCFKCFAPLTPTELTNPTNH